MKNPQNRPEENREGLSRRRFVGLGLATTGLAATGALAAGLNRLVGSPQKAAAQNSESMDSGFNNSSTRYVVSKNKKPSDRVALGNSGVAVSLVGIGTGSNGWGGGSNQTRLGQEDFTRMMRHALDKGLNFFDCADQYGSNPFLARALQGVPREKYVIQTKSNSRDAAGARADIDRYLKELKTDYIDSLIIHCVTEADWTTRFRDVMDVFAAAKKAGKIRAHGVTCHSFEALQAAQSSDWVQINMVRWNAHQAHMDNDVETVRALFKKMREKRQGMIGMKVMGMGDLLNARHAPNGKAITPEECCRFQIESGIVDAFVVGVQQVEHIDQIFNGTQLALREIGYHAVV